MTTSNAAPPEAVSVPAQNTNGHATADRVSTAAAVLQQRQRKAKPQANVTSNGSQAKRLTPAKGNAPVSTAKGIRHAAPRANGVANGVAPAASPQPGAASEPAWQIEFLTVAQIDPNPFQPRTAFDPSEMAELAASVRAYGVLQPITVRTTKLPEPKAELELATEADKAASGQPQEFLDAAAPRPVRYYLIAGERRLRACKEANRRTIPAIIRDDLSEVEAAELALVENVQRSNLNVIEEAAGYKQLMLRFRLKEERIAKKVGKSVATIRDMIKLLQLPAPVQKLLAEKKLTASHGHELLPLAPFERVCVLVAERAAKDHVTALSLQTTPLPNAADLKRAKLVVELDTHTKFDWRRECGQCPYKAFVNNGYSNYCLKPEEWQQKQKTALELQQQEAARIMEEARQANGQPLESDQLTPGSFRHLSHGTPPAGCTAGCSCRSEIRDAHDPTKRYPVCLDPARYTELIQAARQVQEDARRQHSLALWHQAKETLQTDVEISALGRLVTLVALPVLQAEFCHYLGRDQWLGLAESVSESLDISLPWAELLDSEAERATLYARLQESFQTQPEQLLLLCGCLLLAYEANQVARFGGEMPSGLNFILGIRPAQQAELPPDGGDEDVPEGITRDEVTTDGTTPTATAPPDDDAADAPHLEDAAESDQEERSLEAMDVKEFDSSESLKESDERLAHSG